MHSSAKKELNQITIIHGALARLAAKEKTYSYLKDVIFYLEHDMHKYYF